MDETVPLPPDDSVAHETGYSPGHETGCPDEPGPVPSAGAEAGGGRIAPADPEDPGGAVDGDGWVPV